MKAPLIALVGRPNVGKSTLFNALTKKRNALVADFSGVTRDRRFGEISHEVLGNRLIQVVDTGGWMPELFRRQRGDKELLENIEKQVHRALEEAAIVIQIVDAREGVTPLDEDIGKFLRKMNKTYVVAANKVDQPGMSFFESEFYRLGPKEVIPVSAEHKIGMHVFLERILELLGPDAWTGDSLPPIDDGVVQPIRVCIVGRPNVGKSSLLNQIVGDTRSVASSEAGTTTDPVDVEFSFAGRKFILVDTAGIRRHAKRKNDIEQLSVMYAQRNLETADLAFLVLDAAEGVTAQDATIGALVEESGCTTIILANKWDLAPDVVKSAKNGVKKFSEMLVAEMPFLDYAPVLCISAEKGKYYGSHPGVDAKSAAPWDLPKSFDDVWAFSVDLISAREQKVENKDLFEVVCQAIAAGPRISEEIGSMRQVHQVGHRPPQFLAYVNDPNKIPESFRRYMVRAVREQFGFRGNPIRWVFKRRR